jgi:hypothetical protein
MLVVNAMRRALCGTVAFLLNAVVPDETTKH